MPRHKSRIIHRKLRKECRFNRSNACCRPLEAHNECRVVIAGRLGHPYAIEADSRSCRCQDLWYHCIWRSQLTNARYRLNNETQKPRLLFGRNDAWPGHNRFERAYARSVRQGSLQALRRAAVYGPAPSGKSWRVRGYINVNLAVRAGPKRRPSPHNIDRIFLISVVSTEHKAQSGRTTG